MVPKMFHFVSCKYTSYKKIYYKLHAPSYPPENFSNFCTLFLEQWDKACKFERPRTSKYTLLNNPGITSGLLTSIKTNDNINDLWKKSQTKNWTALKDMLPKKTDECNCCTCINITLCIKTWVLLSLNSLVNFVFLNVYDDWWLECREVHPSASL